MRAPLPWRGLLQHLVLTLRLNFRSRAPLIYGYLVPVFFLLAFGSVFRGGSPPLLHEMGQLVTITILGGACFGLPTAMVAERDRGVWRRYRLLPASIHAMILSTSIARTLLIGTAVALQLTLAWCIYRTPWPAYPGQFLLAFLCVSFAFLGIGLIIAMLANDVPAVQAIGQCVFLPMIMIGGVGVPLRTLPSWARQVAGFLPGCHAVAALDACILPEGGGLAQAKFALAALGWIGAAAFLAGFGLFRWMPGPRRLDRAAKGWVGLALFAWVPVGWLATPSVGRPQPPPAGAVNGAEPWQAITEAEIAGIGYDGLPPDDGLISPVASSFDGLNEAARKRLGAIEDRLTYWPPGRQGPLDQRVRNLLCLAAVADLSEDENEGEIALAVFGQLRDAVPAPMLEKVLAWMILHPAAGAVKTDGVEFGIEAAPNEAAVRDRCAAYEKKLLLRLRRDGPAAPSTITRHPGQSSQR